MEPKQHSPTYIALLQAGPRLKPLQQVHAQIIISGLHHSRSLLTKLITLACSAGSIIYTRQIFISIPNPDSFLFNSLIKSSCKSGYPFDAIFFYQQMRLTGLFESNFTFTAVIKACADLSALKFGRVIHSNVLQSGFTSDPFVQAALVSFYAKSGDLVVARKVFDTMPERSIIAWNSMISGYEQNGLAKEAVDVFYLMREIGVQPDSATLVSLLSACSQLGALNLGLWVNEYIIENGFDLNVILGTSLINMYARCGNVGKARDVFDVMQELNVIAWTAMISGYGMHGYGVQAIDLFHQMRVQGPKPNDVTFVAVLSACAHAGLVHEGRESFESMKRSYRLMPRMEHHVCMVDLLGRAGFLDEAIQYIQGSIPGKPAPAIWTALLGACKMHKNFDLGVQVAEHLLAVEPENPSHYVLLSNIYASVGRMDRVEMVRNMMICRGLKKQVGYSLVEIDHVTYMFCMGDESHPKTTEIYQYLDELMWKLKKAGYVPEPESVMHELEEEEREFALRFHSEKLAIAFGLMNTSYGTSIRIVKNLRMCGDCHSAIKITGESTHSTYKLSLMICVEVSEAEWLMHELEEQETEFVPRFQSEFESLFNYQSLLYLVGDSLEMYLCPNGIDTWPSWRPQSGPSSVADCGLSHVELASIVGDHVRRSLTCQGIFGTHDGLSSCLCISRTKEVKGFRERMGKFTEVYTLREESVNHDLIATIERTMKKYADNLLRFLEGMSTRLQQLELYCYNLEKSIEVMRTDLTHENSEADSKLRSLEKHLQEVDCDNIEDQTLFHILSFELSL
ncbi:Pentatricopeptide repeat [Macleaya cordata]|uniref:Pentatricopeptide repeat n=1 Tax=Macleaya cordata TaxID=56857 RepID=A0A200QBC0_MACCD|nr:Pentatricopeptide repeat [Macleaya cordata]